MQKDITQHRFYDSVASLVHSLKRLQLMKRDSAQPSAGRYLPDVQTEVSALKVHAGGYEHTDPVLMRCILNASLLTAEIVYGLDMFEVMAMQECLDKAV